jgi:hypothetical protein
MAFVREACTVAQMSSQRMFAMLLRMQRSGLASRSSKAPLSMESTMTKQCSFADAASSFNPNATNPSDRLDAIGRYINLRDWSFAVIDLMEVTGKSMTSSDPIVVCDQTLTGVSGSLRDLLQQIDEHVEVIREP